MLKIHAILHPTDFSEQSESAFRLACALARDHKAKLLLLHVIEPPPIAAAEGVMVFPLEEDSQAKERLEAIRPADPMLRVQHLSVEGHAAEEIVRVAQAQKCDCIVLGTHGRTGLSRLLMGSVAEEVIRKAPCPVVTVKNPVTLEESTLAQIGAPEGSDAPAAWGD